MSYRIGVKPGRALSVLGMVVGLGFVIFGLAVAIPLAGIFGIFWTVIAAAITIFYAYNAFSSRGVSAYEVNVESSEDDPKKPEKH